MIIPFPAFCFVFVVKWENIVIFSLKSFFFKSTDILFVVIFVAYNQ